MDVIAIVLSLFLLMFLAYRGFSVILFAPVCALCAVSISDIPLLPAYTELFMGKAAVYFKSFFPVFMLGAVFGKGMEESGLARSIARAIIRGLGPDRAIISVVLACAVLTYGGVSLFVVVFAVYPFAASLFRQANIPKRLLPGAIALGAFTFTMDALPGTPQIQNLIPTNFFGTTLYAAPVLGSIGGLLVFSAGLLYLERRRRRAHSLGEGYGDHTISEPSISFNDRDIDWRIAILPLLTVLTVNLLLTRFAGFSDSMLDPLRSYNIALISPSVKQVAGIWSLVMSLSAGIILTFLIGTGRIKGGSFRTALNAGVQGSLLAILNTASEVGYGNVIASLPGFKSISGALMSIKAGGSPLISEAVSITTLAGITGSASGGMSIALDIMAKDWLNWAEAAGTKPEVLHRIASMASGGCDTLPHNGAVITLLAVCGLTHRESYIDIFALTLLKTAAVFAVIIIHMLTGVV